jgi:hypothetical protein
MIAVVRANVVRRDFIILISEVSFIFAFLPSPPDPYLTSNRKLLQVAVSFREGAHEITPLLM